MDRSAGEPVSNDALEREAVQQPIVDLGFPPSTPRCLRGHTPSMITTSDDTPRPRKDSIRGPRGTNDTEPRAFARRGPLGALCVSPWVVEEEHEKVQRAAAHADAMRKVRTSLSQLRRRIQPGCGVCSEQQRATA